MNRTAFPMMFIAVVACAFTAACGNNSASSTTSSTASKTSTAAVVSIGDAPADSVLAFEVTINSASLTNSANQQVSLITKPVRVEVSHLAGTFAALAQVSIPQGTYTGATLTISNPEITYVNASGQTIEMNPTLSSGTVNVTFSPNLVVSGSATAFNFDFDLSKSITFDSSGVPSINPVITIVPATAPAQNGEVDPEHGDVEGRKGTVSSVGTSSFVITIDDGASSMTFNVDANTQYSGVTGLADLKAGMQVEVSATMQSDGSLLAQKVEVQTELESDESQGADLEGFITAVTGSPATQISVLIREMESPMPSAPALGSTADIQITSTTKFGVHSSHMDLTALPFTPTFDATTITKGQNVDVETILSSSTPAAQKVMLAPQALRGTASAITSSNGVTSFTLTLPSDSAFASLTGASTVTVYQLSSTRMKGLTSIAPDASVRVRGLLFFDGTSYQLVAKVIESQ